MIIEEKIIITVNEKDSRMKPITKPTADDKVFLRKEFFICL
tara:strand:+ start:496 stop:618 length:123 start_codon:yes stop_codon:yes gene_type:complete